MSGEHEAISAIHPSTRQTWWERTTLTTERAFQGGLDLVEAESTKGKDLNGRRDLQRGITRSRAQAIQSSNPEADQLGPLSVPRNKPQQAERDSHQSCCRTGRL